MKEISDLIGKTEKFMITAEKTLGIEDYDSCVSRCYYAMFFMAEAALLSKGITAHSHKGVISKFGEHLIKTKILERELGKALNDAYDKRLIGDYGVGFAVTKEQAKDLLETARDFVSKLKDFLQKQE
jgi:uncharacterized protein (UPF0332 family)